MDDDTVVIFFSDNGRLTPRGIHWPFDQGLRVPVIARDAKNFRLFLRKRKPVHVSKRVVSLLDLTATTLALAASNVHLECRAEYFSARWQTRLAVTLLPLVTVLTRR